MEYDGIAFLCALGILTGVTLIGVVIARLFGAL